MLRSLPGPVPQRVRDSSVAVAAVVVVAALVVGGWVWVQRQARADVRSVSVGAPVAPPAPASSSPVGSGDDAGVHLRHIRASLVRSSEALVEAQKDVRLVVPNLDRNFLAVQVRRLEASDAVLAQARRDVEEALEDLEVLRAQVEGGRP